ncbi:type II toxin-antitoxin system death-on-curing family toxin [Candidatus Collierbacteria bacterium]|nr:type II toxin-antitoxin system death-on-curing family toxin [Candidatus Collierbacteria bacterium]
MKVFTVRQVLILHERMIQKYGGSSGVRDMGMLESAVGRPFATFGGEDLYSDVFMKAGAFIQSIVKNHPFIDGNKRTAFTGTIAFLLASGVIISAGTNQVVKFMLRVANENLSVDEIAKWLEKNTKSAIIAS